MVQQGLQAQQLGGGGGGAGALRRVLAACGARPSRARPITASNSATLSGERRLRRQPAGGEQQEPLASRLESMLFEPAVERRA